MVGYHESPDGPITYAGRVGSGLSRADIALPDRAIVRARSRHVSDQRGGAAGRDALGRAAVVVEVRFSEWTQSGLLRQPVFLGVRDDRDPATVVREHDGRH